MISGETKGLIRSATRGEYAEGKRSIEAGADVNAEDNWGFTALMMASSNEHIDVVDLLIDAEANVNARAMRGYTAKSMAERQGHVYIASLHRDAGARR
jgi:ankyrin repeat protein